MDDPNVVRALNYATPKEDMLASLMHGAGEIANHVIAKVKYWDSSVPAVPYDLEKAKEFMAQSSVPDGFSMNCLIVSGDQVERQQAETLQQEWAKIGVEMSIEAVDVSTIWERWTSGDEMCFTYPGAGLSSDALVPMTTWQWSSTSLARIPSGPVGTTSKPPIWSSKLAARSMRLFARSPSRSSKDW
jgi:peptide/nickel transport system substrate-binding protein